MSHKCHSGEELFGSNGTTRFYSWLEFLLVYIHAHQGNESLLLQKLVHPAHQLTIPSSIFEVETFGSSVYPQMKKDSRFFWLTGHKLCQ